VGGDQGEASAGAFMRTQIPRFRLPESIIDEETDREVRKPAPPPR